MNFMCDVPPRRLSSTLSLDDILYVQEMFLTKGLHHIMVPDMWQGRTLIHDFLKSMNYFHDIACLTHSDQPALDDYESNLLEGVADYCGQDIILDTVEEYFLEHYCADFMWIELSESLLNNPLVLQIVHVMHDLDIAHRIPVVVISCAKNS